MVSNISFALRSILRKNITNEFRVRTELDAANDHAVTTILSAILLLPLLVLTESITDIQNSLNQLTNKTELYTALLISGLCYYIYNEVQNMVLSSLGPVPTAVGNTLKRVVIFVALYYFTDGETFPLPKIIGCAIAIIGCMTYAIFNAYKM